MNKLVPQFAQFAQPLFAQAASPQRKSYRDIPGQFDRMGQQAASYQDWMQQQGQGMWPGTNAVANLVAPCGAAACCPVPPATNAYERAVGLPRICIPGCNCETVETSVCGPFTLTGVYIAPKAAHFLSLTRFQIGCNNLMVNCDPIPAELFSCCEVDENIFTAPTVGANSPICLELENDSKNDVQFKGALKGLLCISCQ